MKERRKHNRDHFSGQVILKAENHEITCHAAEVSSSGVSVQTGETLQKGIIYSILFLDANIENQGMVVHSFTKGDKYIYGMRFAAPFDEEDLRRLG